MTENDWDRMERLVRAILSQHEAKAKPEATLAGSAAILEERKKPNVALGMGHGIIIYLCNVCGAKLHDGLKDVVMHRGRNLCQSCYRHFTLGCERMEEKTSARKYFWRCSDCGAPLGFTWPAPVRCCGCQCKVTESTKPTLVSEGSQP